MQVVTGFHAIEEKLRKAENDSSLVSSLHLLYAKPGPRVKKMIAQAQKAGVSCREVPVKELDALVAPLPEEAREHRGVVITCPEEKRGSTTVNFDHFLAKACEPLAADKNTSIVVVLDSVTDPHNVGAIIRSCDQFGADLCILPERRGAKNSEVIDRASAGASAWVPVAVVPNLVRAVEQLKEAGYWIYGADAGGESAPDAKLTGKIALIMGSEGTGMSRLLTEKCDTILSIPTCGKLDSLNVSVAAGVLLYEIHRQSLKK